MARLNQQPTIVAALALGFLIGAGWTRAWAGCTGPVINGVCQGQTVPWDTHLPGEEHPPPPAGFRWDWRGSDESLEHSGEINPFTGEDPHDSRWGSHGHRAPAFPPADDDDTPREDQDE